MKRESRTVDRSHQVDSSTQRHLPLVDLLVDMRAELMELAVASGLKVLTTMLEADRTAICGPRYQHDAEREAVRAGTVPSEVVLGASVSSSSGSIFAGTTSGRRLPAPGRRRGHPDHPAGARAREHSADD